jgi:hypothetical protein
MANSRHRLDTGLTRHSSYMERCCHTTSTGLGLEEGIQDGRGFASTQRFRAPTIVSTRAIHARRLVVVAAPLRARGGTGHVGLNIIMNNKSESYRN